MTKPTALHLIELGRVLPNDVETERVVLGAIMPAPPVLAEVRQILDGSPPRQALIAE